MLNKLQQRKGKKRKEKESTNTNTKCVFDFRKSLLAYGFKEELVDEWMTIRKSKKAINSQFSYNAFISQIEKCGAEKNEYLNAFKEWRNQVLGTYSLTLFENLHGKLDINPTIQSNKLTSLPFTFTPIEKTINTKQELTFFSTLSYNTFNIAGVGAGVFYKNRGVHYKYLCTTELKVNGHEFGVNIMF